MNREGQKCVEVSWKAQTSEDGDILQLQPTSYPIEHFPIQGYKLLIDFLVSNLHFPKDQSE